MGLMDAFKSMRMKDPVDVDAQVVSVSEPPHATHGTAVMNLVVQLPGQEAQSIECTSVPAPVAKWPTPGGQLPVTVDRANPEKCKVRWDDVPDSADIAKQQADALAAQMNQGGGGGGQVVMGGDADVNEIVAALQQQYPGAQIEVEGAQVVSDASPSEASDSDAGDDDRLAQLERLAKLKASGALSEEEFEREKARILGS
jgi:Short C-terminal domain